MVLAAVLMQRSIESYSYFFGMYHDDGIYMVVSKALAQGHGFHIISLPGQPPETKYPIGFPLLLSVVWMLASKFPGNLVIFETIQCCLALAFMAVVALYLVSSKKVTPILGLVILASSALNFHYLDFAPMIMSDLPCALVSILALWMMERQEKEAYRLSSAAGMGVLFSCCFLIRSAALVVPICGLVFLATRKKYRHFATVAAVVVGVLVLQMGWQFWQQRAVDPFLGYYTNYLNHSLGTLPPLSRLWSDISMVYLYNFYRMVSTLFPLSAANFHLDLPAHQLGVFAWIGLALASLPLIAGAILELRRASVIGLYCFFYVLVLTVWMGRTEWRHIFPVLPLGYYLYYSGLRNFSRALKGRLGGRPRWYQSLCGVLAIAFGCYLVVGTTSDAVQKTGRYSSALALLIPGLSASAQDADYQEVYQWVREHTRLADTFVCNNDPVFFLNTGRQAVFPSRLESWRFLQGKLIDPDSMLQAMRFAHARYVVNEPTYRSMGYATIQAAQSLTVLDQKYPGLLKPVFRSAHGLILVCAIDSARLPDHN